MAGYGALAGWADLIDRINVFPVADGDTGTNLRISLAPLRDPECGKTALLLGSGAVGNAGNIAAAFFVHFVRAREPAELAARSRHGANSAWEAVAAPRKGTMLSVFDTLAASLEAGGVTAHQDLADRLRQTVADGPQHLDVLARAGVVDAGALAMYIFFASFFQYLAGADAVQVPVLESFPGRLRPAGIPQAEGDTFCVDTEIALSTPSAPVRDQLGRLGDSVVARQDRGRLKIHVHTREPASLREHLDGFGRILHWSDHPITSQTRRETPANDEPQGLHLLTDAAGSLSDELAGRYNIGLLDSYIISQDRARPERCCDPEEIYRLMREGQRIGTAQASAVERHQHYRCLVDRHHTVLYLCVGSAYTGNLATALAWKKQHDPEDRFLVVDTGAASGRLGLIVLLTARAVCQGASREEALCLARRLVHSCMELVFIDELRYLAAGGRISRTKGLFGDLLGMKPVISPQAEGVRTVGTVRNSRQQLDLLQDHLRATARADTDQVVLLQYSDNRTWVRKHVLPLIRHLLPQAEIHLVPLSLTSGVHMGPGTWAVAFQGTETGPTT